MQYVYPCLLRPEEDGRFSASFQVLPCDNGRGWQENSANDAERPAWAMEDLLFISNFGEGDARQISFAHFAAPTGISKLPTLNVLGWDDRDTALHLDHVARELTTHLAWPDNEADANAWREQWRTAFTLGHREVITTAQQLSTRLAALARATRDRVHGALNIETENGRDDRRGFLASARARERKHSHDYGGASMCAQTPKRPARARPARFAPATTPDKSEETEQKQTTFVNSTSGLVQYAG